MATDPVPADDYAVVWTAATMVEAQLALAALEAAGIPSISDDFDVNPYDGVWVAQQGWAKIRTSAKDAKRARETIKQALEMPPPDEADSAPGSPEDASS